MHKKITLAILSLIISASVILTPTLSVFAFGRFSFADDDMAYFKNDNGQNVTSTKGYAGYHVTFQNGYEAIWRFKTTSTPDAYVSGYMVYSPIQDRLYYIIKQTEKLHYDFQLIDQGTGQVSNKCYYQRGKGWNGSQVTWRSNWASVGVTAGIESLYPIRFWFGSYYYIFIPVIRADGGGAYIQVANYNGVQQYSAERYSEIHADELAALAEASGMSDLEDIEGIGGIGEGAMDELTEPAVDASSESESFSEDFSQIESIISNIDDFSSLAQSNLNDVSEQMSHTRSALDKVIEWCPRPLIIFCIFGLVVLIIVKVMGR